MFERGAGALSQVKEKEIISRKTMFFNLYEDMFSYSYGFRGRLLFHQPQVQRRWQN